MAALIKKILQIVHTIKSKRIKKAILLGVGSQSHINKIIKLRQARIITKSQISDKFGYTHVGR